MTGERVREVVPAVLAGERLDRALAMITGLARAEVAELIADGRVLLNGRMVQARSRRLAAGDVLEADVPPPRGATSIEPERGIAFDVVYADDEVIVVDKPAGLVVHPGAGRDHGTLVQGILARFPEVTSVGEPGRPGIVHRLDKGTSGLLVVARSARAYASLVAQLQVHGVDREYAALVWGVPEAPIGLVDAPIGRGARDPTRMVVSARGREARTHYVVHQAWPAAGVALLDCRLETGRTHQIRVHLAAIGHPVVGDPRYGGSRRRALAADRPMLHAERLVFDHPATGERVRFDSPLPDDLLTLLAHLDG